jgi:hypothetical protein
LIKAESFLLGGKSMPVFLCRWPNGDVSIVSARNKDDAVAALDEFDNADHAHISQLKEFLVDFRLNDEGRLELKQFGEATLDEIMEKAFPELDKTLLSDDLDETSEAYTVAIRQAVELERKRLWKKKKRVKQAKTEWGQEIQKQMGAAAVVADRAVERGAKEILKNFDSRKPKH